MIVKPEYKPGDLVYYFVDTPGKNNTHKGIISRREILVIDCIISKYFYIFYYTNNGHKIKETQIIKKIA